MKKQIPKKEKEGTKMTKGLLFFVIKEGKNKSIIIIGIITVNPPEVWTVCALPTRSSKLITLLT